jgi:hypothetical protein
MVIILLISWWLASIIAGVCRNTPPLMHPHHLNVWQTENFLMMRITEESRAVILNQHFIETTADTL